MSGEALTVHPADPLDRIDGMEEAEIADRIDAIRTSMGSNLLILGRKKIFECTEPVDKCIKYQVLAM